MINSNKVVVFILLGQSNAVGHGIPMIDEDKIKIPLKNVFGLNRTKNQSYDNDKLYWTGYTSSDMNLAEEQDDTYSVANCLAKLWQQQIDAGNKLPDLYIVHIAIGAQGVTEKYMWYPKREKVMIPGKLTTVNISLYPYAAHIFSLLNQSFEAMQKKPEYIGLHWRGGEEDTTRPNEYLKSALKDIYYSLFNGFYEAIGEKVHTVLHKIVCRNRCLESDPSGKSLENMHYINEVFSDLCNENRNITMFDACNYPGFDPNTRENGIFMKDAVHYTPQVNNWVAEEILKGYTEKN